MASGSQNMTTYNARTVTGSNSAASPVGALLLSGEGRADDATGDTWIFLDSAGGTDTPWGIKHDQANNKIQIFGAGTNSVWTEMNTGNTYIGGSLNTGSTLTVRAQNDAHEGGEIVLSPATDSFSTVHIDAYNSMFRLHDGTNERFKVNISSGNTTINGNLGIGTDYAVLGGSYKLYVNGSSYFTDHMYIGRNNSAHIFLINKNWTKGTNPSSQTYSAIEYNDVNNSRVALLEATLDTSGNSRFNIYLVPNVASSTSWSGIILQKTNANVLTVNIAGTTTVSGTVHANGGYLQSTCNGNTVTIGSQNTGFTHITNSTTRPFWFNNDIQIEKGKIIGGAGTQYRPYQLYLGRHTTSGSNALNTGNPLIEFSNSDRSQYCQLIYSDYDSVAAPDSLTLVGNQAGTHFIAPKVNVGGYINNSYALSTASFICNSWIRTTGSTGWYNESYGGGWYMQDSTYIRNFGTKQLYLNAQVNVDATLRLWNNTRQITRASRSVSWISGRDSALIREDNANGYHGVVMTKTVNGAWTIGNYNAGGWYNYLLFSYTSDAHYNAGTNSVVTIRMRDSGVVESAMWNDYAEYRKANIIEPGRVVVETGNDDLQLCNQRLAAGGRVISDTYGFAIGQTKECQTPIAVSGRVLVYTYKDRNMFKPGDAVCTAPNGTVDVMTRKEIILYPERIIGTVSAVPTYETWYGGGNYDENGTLIPIPVNGRIWIYVR